MGLADGLEQTIASFSEKPLHLLFPVKRNEFVKKTPKSRRYDGGREDLSTPKRFR